MQITDMRYAIVVAAALGLSACSGISDCKGDGDKCAALLNEKAAACAESYQFKQGNAKRRACEKAVSAVGEAKLKAAVPGLIQILAQPDTNIPGDDHREEAAKALGRIGDPTAIPPLIQAIDVSAAGGTQAKEKATARASEAAAAALGRLKAKAGVDVLMQVVQQSPNDHVVLNAVRSLGQIGDPAAVEVLVDTALKHKAKFMRKTAVIALGEIASPKAIDALIQLMFIEYQGASFYREASYALYQIGPAASDALLETMALKNPAVNDYFEKHGGIKESAIKAKCGFVLGDLRDKRALKPLLEAFKSAAEKKDPVVLVYASAPLGALASAKDKKVGEALRAQMLTPDASVRAPIMRALVQLGYAPAAADMVEAMTEDSFIKACTKLGNSEEACAAEGTKATMRGAQKAATDNASMLAGAKLLPRLKKIVAAEKNPQMKAYMAAHLKPVEAAKECGDKPACWAKKLSDADPLVRERAAWQLGRYKDPATLDALTAALKDKKDTVRSAAIMSYYVYGDGRAVEQIEQTLDKEQGAIDYVRVNEDLKRLLVYLQRAKK